MRPLVRGVEAESGPIVVNRRGVFPLWQSELLPAMPSDWVRIDQWRVSRNWQRIACLVARSHGWSIEVFDRTPGATLEVFKREVHAPMIRLHALSPDGRVLCYSTSTEWPEEVATRLSADFAIVTVVDLDNAVDVSVRAPGFDPVTCPLALNSDGDELVYGTSPDGDVIHMKWRGAPTVTTRIMGAGCRGFIALLDSGSVVCGVDRGNAELIQPRGGATEAIDLGGAWPIGVRPDGCAFVTVSSSRWPWPPWIGPLAPAFRVRIQDQDGGTATVSWSSESWWESSVWRESTLHR